MEPCGWIVKSADPSRCAGAAHIWMQSGEAMLGGGLVAIITEACYPCAAVMLAAWIDVGLTVERPLTCHACDASGCVDDVFLEFEGAHYPGPLDADADPIRGSYCLRHALTAVQAIERSWSKLVDMGVARCGV